MKKVLVTGATGFVGRHCLPLLQANGCEVHAVSSKAQTDSQSEVIWHQADLLDPNQATGLLTRVRPTHLLHLAWYAEPRSYWTSKENLRWVEASLRLLRLFEQQGGVRVVMAGTCAEYDWTNGICSEEKTQLAPTTLYGACKHALQLIVDAYESQSNLSAAWGRLFFLYGPHESPERLVAATIRSLLRNEVAQCSAGHQQRDFLFAEDASAAFVALLDSDVRGPVNIASGHAVAVKEIVYRIAEKLNRQELVQLGAIPSAVDEPPLLVADVSRLQKEVGWTPHFDLNQGLALTIDWWKQSLSQK